MSLSQLSKITDVDERDMATFEAIEQWAFRDPVKAKEWLMLNQGKVSSETLSSLQASIANIESNPDDYKKFR